MSRPHMPPVAATVDRGMSTAFHVLRNYGGVRSLRTTPVGIQHGLNVLSALARRGQAAMCRHCFANPKVRYNHRCETTEVAAAPTGADLLRQILPQQRPVRIPTAPPPIQRLLPRFSSRAGSGVVVCGAVTQEKE